MTAASPLSRRLSPWLAPWLALSGLVVLAFLVLTPFLFFFYRVGVRMLLELRHVPTRFIGPRAHGQIGEGA